MDERYMRIGEIAAFFSVSVKAIRIYEKMGILRPVKVHERTKYRYYSADQVKQLCAVLELKELGFSLAEIKKVLDGGTTGAAFAAALAHKRAEWQNVIASAENKAQAIDSIIERLSLTESAAGMHELTEDERAWLLVKMVCVEDLRTQSTLSEAIWL